MSKLESISHNFDIWSSSYTQFIFDTYLTEDNGFDYEVENFYIIINDFSNYYTAFKNCFPHYEVLDKNFIRYMAEFAFKINYISSDEASEDRDFYRESSIETIMQELSNMKLLQSKRYIVLVINRLIDFIIEFSKDSNLESVLFLFNIEINDELQRIEASYIGCNYNE